MNPHYHWTIIGYDNLDPKTGQMSPFTEYYIDAEDSDTAIARAMAIFRRRHYDIRAVRECFAPDQPKEKEPWE